MTAELVIYCAASLFVGVCLGFLLAAFLKGASEPDMHPDSERLDFLLSHGMSLDCSPKGETWAVLDGHPRSVIAMNPSPRQAIDRARELMEDGR